MILVVILTSCFKETIELDLNEEDPKLIITAWITDSQNLQYVTVSRSTNYLAEQNIDYVAGAVVSLSNEEQSSPLKEQEISRYFLSDTWNANIGQEYIIASGMQKEEIIIQSI